MSSANVPKFYVDVRLVDDLGVPGEKLVRIPVLRTEQFQNVTSGFKKLHFPGEKVVLTSGEPLSKFLTSSGQQFGKDASRWYQVGDAYVKVTEEGGLRYFRTTAVLTGVELDLFVQPELYDSRLAELPGSEPGAPFTVRRFPVENDESWQQVVSDQPLSMGKRRQNMITFLVAKMDSGIVELMVEGCHGMYEFSINKDHHQDVSIESMTSLLRLLDSDNIRVASLAAAALWGLSTTGECRRQLNQLEAVQAVVKNLKRALKMTPVPDLEPEVVEADEALLARGVSHGFNSREVVQGEDDPASPSARQHLMTTEAMSTTAAATGGSSNYNEASSAPASADNPPKESAEEGFAMEASTTCDVGGGTKTSAVAGAPAVDPFEGCEEGVLTEPQRNVFQRNLLGALAMLLVDRSCRQPYLKLEPNFATIFELGRNLPEGYTDQKEAADRRCTAAKALTSIMIRDYDARQSLISTGSLKHLLAMLVTEGPGEAMIRYCSSSILALLILDDDVMALIQQRGEMVKLFQACLMLIDDCIKRMHVEMERLLVGMPPQYDVVLGVRVAEGAAQALWGSAFSCLSISPTPFKMDDIIKLSEMAADCHETGELPLSRVCHALMGTLACLSTVPETASMLMSCPDDLAVKVLLKMSVICETDVFERAGHVKAAACAALAFLSCHPIGARGEDCLVGPYRLQLLELGTFSSLLRAALAGVIDETCNLVVQQAAAVGLMYLCTMAGDVAAADLSMYSTILMGGNSSQIVEYLMAGFWILLRNPSNRALLGTSFSPDPAQPFVRGITEKINDVIKMNEMTDFAEEKAALVNNIRNNKKMSALLEDIKEENAIDLLSPQPKLSQQGTEKYGLQQPSLDGESSITGKVLDGGTDLELIMKGGESFESPFQHMSYNIEQEGRTMASDEEATREDGLSSKAATAPYSQSSVVARNSGRNSQRNSMKGGMGAGRLSYAGVADSVAECGLSRPGSSGRFDCVSVSNSQSLVTQAEEGLLGRMSSMRRDGSLRSSLEDLEHEVHARGDESPRPHGGMQISMLDSATGYEGDRASVGPAGELGGPPLVSAHHKLQRQLSKQITKKLSRVLTEEDHRIVEAIASDLIEKFDKKLDEDWGLMSLVKVGESWLPSILDQDEIGEVSDMPVIKLFEFLISSLCLFLVEEEVEEERRELDLFMLSSPPGVRAKTWWTVDAHAPEPSPDVEPAQSRALDLLLSIMGLHLVDSWKCVQLGVLTVWNVCSRNASIEKRVVEHSVASKLLDIMCNEDWPPSLRELASGFLSFLTERFSNLSTFPLIELPPEIKWGVQKPPTFGLVPTIAGYINLINSKIPVLEYRGCHGIARICYSAPYGCTKQREFVNEAKAVVAMLGGVEALIALMKRANRRYHDIVTGNRTSSVPKLTRLNTTDTNSFQKDMGGLRSQQDVYFSLLAALLNVSVLRTVQPLVAKRGLTVLLGTNTMFAGHISGGTGFVLPAGDAEEKLLFLCSSIIQNISLHPDNRTRLYKAELAGGCLLDRFIEEDERHVAQDETLKEVAEVMSPIRRNLNSAAAVTNDMGRRNMLRASAPATLLSGGLAAHSRSASSQAGSQSCQSPTTLTTSMATSRPATSKGSSRSISPKSSTALRPSTAPSQALSGGGALHLAGAFGRNRVIKRTEKDMVGMVRPKAVFPPIIEARDEVAYAPSKALAALAAASSPLMHQNTERRMPMAGMLGTQNPSEADAKRRPSHAGGSKEMMSSDDEGGNHKKLAGGASTHMGIRFANMPTHGSSNLPDAAGDLGSTARMDPFPLGYTKEGFIKWLESIEWGDGDDMWAEDGGSEAPTQLSSKGSMAGKKTHRRAMWNEKGEWLEKEPESMKVLNRILCRPVHHLWMEAPEARARHGQARWQPTVSEYQESSIPPTGMPKTASQLMTALLPRDNVELQASAEQMIETGRYTLETVPETTSPVVVVPHRPGTAFRRNGQMALTVLRPTVTVIEEEDHRRNKVLHNQSTVLAAGTKQEASLRRSSVGGASRQVGDHTSNASAMSRASTMSRTPSSRVQTAPAGGRRTSTAGLSTSAGLTSRSSAADKNNKSTINEDNDKTERERAGMSKGGGGQQVVSKTASGRSNKQTLTDKPAQPKKEALKADEHPFQLKVCLGPKRPRQVISFEKEGFLYDDPRQPKLAVFEHVQGARVSEGLFPVYQLPNGKQAFMYYNGGVLLDEVHVDMASPPPRPSTVPQALQQTMPLANVLDSICKAPGTAPPFIPYKPVPRLVPLPGKHVLRVKDPSILHLEHAYGDLKEDNLQLLIRVTEVRKTETSVRTEDVEVLYRPPWLLPESVFRPRAKESDCKDFWDTDATQIKMFEKDWARACKKEKFTIMLSRENKASQEQPPKTDKEMMQELHDVLLDYISQWYPVFVYYTSAGSADPYHMSLNAYTAFIDEVQIPDPESQFCKRSDCDTMFIVCNFQPNKKSAEAQVNNENGMMRYEFLEFLCRAGISKYGKGQATTDVPQAVRMLLSENIVPNLNPASGLSSNTFRNQRLYCEDVDNMLKKNLAMLKALYSRYRLKPYNGGLRLKVVKLDGWMQLLNDCKLIDTQFTIQDATLAFLWSRMQTIDEIKDYPKYISITFVDFMEALGRVAEMKSLPPLADLGPAGFDNIMDWAVEKERLESVDSKDSKQQGAPAGSTHSPDAGSTATTAAAGDVTTIEEDQAAEAQAKAHKTRLDIFQVRESAGFAKEQTRGLDLKLESLLDLMFRRLYFDPEQPHEGYNSEGLLKLLKRIDKELGP
ncbi:hypothetical protein CEUSTIGMA_g9064.t1 [Chlamydomonas eustigma]|uniref:Uncharacterized protein n=1 Tax=Chlamydomonas eustigma TaxID=1157962 RepID=A0A250XF26_9CHLO|nr:hypothetical protein CEUSTIGMA_g9064.t1 [Chlamydomonas eustigma]|eukprot:GAX81636.1 hypothetical protein CEUSTIGMA_g9064.t1 [Chlamydomonas eustigma]